MNNSRPILWILVAALAIVSAALAYLLLGRDGDAPPPKEQETAAAVQPGAPAARFTRAATTADPNGFSNIRQGASVEHPIVGRVEQGETFTTYPQTGEWWEVRTADGTTGYMASAWIRMTGGAAADPQPGPEPAAVEVPAQIVGTGPAAAPPPRVDTTMLFPDSDRRLLGPEDVSALSAQELRLARNEIYARRGRAFADPALRRHFEQFDWYRPVALEVALNRVETANVAFLQRMESSK